MIELKILVYLASILLGYLIGRWSHCYLTVWAGNPKWAPHHWIYGLILIIIGLVYFTLSWGYVAFTFGSGLFISDLNDFFCLRIFAPDPKGEKKFWHID